MEPAPEMAAEAEPPLPATEPAMLPAPEMEKESLRRIFRSMRRACECMLWYTLLPAAA